VLLRPRAAAVLSARARRASAAAIAAVQLRSGQIPHGPRGPTDPWNHVEAALALDLAGRHDDAARAYAWLVATERPGGGFLASFSHDGRPNAAHLDTNATCYLATGLLGRYLVTGRPADVRPYLPACFRALALACALEAGSGWLPWSLAPSGEPARESLLAATSSVVSSLRHGARLAAELGGAPPEPLAACADRLAERVAREEARFADRSDYAMDWYYPVLAGALPPQAGRERLEAGATRYVTEHGVRCRASQRWVTTAETAEAAMAYATVGEVARAEALLATVADKRRAGGAYLTGLVYPERAEFPAGEVTTYSAAAVLLADDVLRRGVAAELFASLAVRATSARRLRTAAESSSSKRPDAMASL